MDVQTLTPLKLIGGAPSKTWLCIVAFAICSCGGGGSGGDDNAVVNTVPKPLGSAPAAAGWSAADDLKTVQGIPSGVPVNPFATLSSIGVATVSTDYASSFGMFQSGTSSDAWSPVPDLPFNYVQNTRGHFLANDRLGVIVESRSSAPVAIVEATYQGGWTNHTVVASQSGASSLGVGHVFVGTLGQRALSWFESGIASNPGIRYFSASQGSTNWDPNSTPPEDVNFSLGTRGFLTSGAFASVEIERAPFESSDLNYGNSLREYLYENGSWSAPTQLVNPTVPTNRVGCAALAPLGADQYALAWLEETPVAGSATKAWRYTAKFALFDRSTPLIVAQELFPAGVIPASSSRGPPCPRLNATSSGELTFVWVRGMEMLARRYANGSFAGDPVSILIPGQDNWLYRWTGAFDGLGNFRMVFSLNDRVLTSEYKIDQGIWTAPAVLWDGAVNGSSVAVNSRGDAIVVWTAYAERTPGTPDKGKNISLMTRRFTR